MKKILIPLIAAMLAILCFLGYWINVRLTQTSYDADVVKYGAQSLNEGGIRAEVDGQEIALADWALDGLVSKLRTASTKRDSLRQVPADTVDHMAILFGTSCRVDLWSLDAGGDDTVVQFVSPKSSYLFQLNGYKLFYWVRRVAEETAV